MPKITESPNDPNYHKDYYQKHKDTWNAAPKKKADYCKRVYDIELSIEDIQQLGDDYKIIARFLRDSAQVHNMHAGFLEKKGVSIRQPQPIV